MQRRLLQTDVCVWMVGLMIAVNNLAVPNTAGWVRWAFFAGTLYITRVTQIALRRRIRQQYRNYYQGGSNG